MGDTARASERLSSEEPDDENEPEAKKPSAQILREELREAAHTFELSGVRLLFSAVAAGLEIGFSLFLMALLLTQLANDGLPRGVVEIFVANAYSFGFILIILGRSELFTEQTSLAVLLVLNGRASVLALIRLWSIVFLGNLIGATLSALFNVLIAWQVDVIDPEVLVNVSKSMVSHRPLAMVISGITAGWLMGLLSWLVAAGRETISQIIIVWMITTVIGLAHLHHSILGSVEVLAGVFISGGPSLFDFTRFLFWTTLGNAFGGPVFLALLKHAHARVEERDNPGHAA